MGWVKTGSDRLISRWRWWGWGQKCDPRHLKLTDILISRKAFPTNKQTDRGSALIFVYKYLCIIEKDQGPIPLHLLLNKINVFT